jgi:hypothetical protein
MTSKLGYHFQVIPSWAQRQSYAEFIKIIDPPSYNPFPNSKIIGRHYISDDESNRMVMAGKVGAREWFGACLDSYNKSPYVYAWEGPNEPSIDSEYKCKMLCEFTNEWVSLVHSIQKKTIALCLSVGWPDVNKAKYLKDAMSITDYWAVHEYGAPTMQADMGWYCLRYKRTISELKMVGARIPQLFITECGIDGGVINKPKRGWKSFCGEDQYIEQLKWYDKELQKDPAVLGAKYSRLDPTLIG